MVERDFDKAWETLSALTDVRDRITGYEFELSEDNSRAKFNDFIQAVTFSDTIVIYTRGSTKKDYLILLVVVSELFHKALCSCVPLRIGIAHGIFYFNLTKSMYAGPALIEAYRIGEACQWLGITLANSLELPEHNIKFAKHGETLFTEWNVPYKEGASKHRVINWPFAFKDDLKVVPPVTVSQFYEAFEPIFGDFETLDLSSQQKYINTVEFMNSKLIGEHNA